MSISTVITQGFGSFGKVNFLPVVGYGNFGGTPAVARSVVSTALGGGGGSAEGSLIINRNRRRKIEDDDIEVLMKHIIPMLDRMLH